MVNTHWKTHPMMVIAASAVIITCLLAIGIMTGILPSPFAKERGYTPADLAATHPSVPPGNAYAPSPSTSTARQRSSERTSASETNTAPAAGATHGAGPSQTVTGSGPAAAGPGCAECGSVSSVRTVRKQGEAGLIGPAAGALVGGVVGNQIGSGRGNTVATVVGAAGGAAAGTEIERRYKSTTHYVVSVRMNDGRVRTFDYASAPGLQTGDKVRVVDGRLVRD